MNVTITANGYRNLKAEVAEIKEGGARVIVNRKGIDKAPRNIYFNWDAIKEGKLEMPEVKPATKTVRIGEGRRSWEVEVPTEPTDSYTVEDVYGKDGARITRTHNTYVQEILIGSIAGAKTHKLWHTIDQFVEVDADGNEISNYYREHAHPTCGTTRSSRTGGHYELNIRLAEEITCGKCSK